MDEKLLCKLDNRAVGTADMLARSSLGAEPGDDLDDQVNLVGQERIEVDERLALQRGQGDVCAKSCMCGELPTVLLVGLSQSHLSRRVLRQHAFACDFRDVGRFEVHLLVIREAVLQSGEL